jgi:type I restriction enzyme, S subunit
MTDLPPGWAVAKVNELATVLTGPAFRSAEFGLAGEGPRLLRGDNIEPGALRWAAHRTWPPASRSGLEHLLVEVGDIILALDRPLISSGLKLAKVTQADIPALLVQRVALVRAHLPSLGRYLYLAFEHHRFRQYLQKGQTGTQVPHVTLRSVADFEIPLPPSAEQERIVAAIEEAFSKLDAGEAALRATRQRLKRLRESVLTAAVTGRLVPQDPTDEPASKLLANLGAARCDSDGLPDLPHSWEWARLGAMGDVVGGVTKDAKRQDDADFIEVPYLRVANVQRGFLDLGTVATIRVSVAAAQKLALIDGDVLFNEGGDRDKLGRGWVWEGQVPDCIHQNHVFRCRLAGGMQPKLVSWWGNTFGKGWFETHGKQTTNLASLNMTTLKSFPIPVAPVNEQERIVAAVEYQFSFLEACERTVDAGLVRSAAMRRSILKAAFEGRLAAQDPSDEPASVLLERLRAERDAIGKTTTPPRAQRPQALASTVGLVAERD